MDHLIGQRFSLISKSEIRYVGTLHEINPEQSTIALENVFSFGTEDRQVSNYVPPSQQQYEYIVFRGSDVKDIKIDEEQKESEKPSQPPNDPAILNSSRPIPSQPASQGPPSTRGESPYPPPGYPPPGYGGFYHPPPPGQFGRGYGPPPGNFGPAPGFPPYGPPPPGFFGPPGHGFQQGPTRFPPQSQAPIGHPGQGPQGQVPQGQTPPNQAMPGQRPPPPQPSPGPMPTSASKQTTELPVGKPAQANGSQEPVAKSEPAPAPGVTEPQPPKAVDIPSAVSEATKVQQTSKVPPTQPRSNRIVPAMPFTVNQKSFIPPVPNASTTSEASSKPAPTKPVQSHTEMEEASRQAKEAVAAAMAKINAQPVIASVPQTPGSVENLAEKVSQMTTGPPMPRGRGGYRVTRGGRTTSGAPRQRMEIPQSDFDFESANAKFNKEDLIKEAIASGSPLGEGAEDPSAGIEEQANGTSGITRKDSYPLNTVIAYNKTTSFFDNISSEAKDREDSTDGRFNARAQRGQEFKKNVETFGQGNVDSGYRGRGRGGYRGRGRGDYNRGGNYRGYRGRGRGSADVAEATQN